MINDTPRTDAAWLMFSTLGMINAGEDFARQLERELSDANSVALRYAGEIGRLKEEIEQNAWKSSPVLAQAQIDQLAERIAELEIDKARLDWIEANADQIHCSESVPRNIEQYWIAPTRAAIDATMKGTP